MKILLTASEYPDIDGVACAMGYQNYLSVKDSANEYVAAFGGELHAEPRFVCEKLKLNTSIIGDQDRLDKFILLDASEPKGLPKQVRREDVIEVIDHRMFADYAAFPNAKFRVEPVGAAATQVAELYHFDQNVRLPVEYAALLLCGIYSNTVNFQADTTTFRDERMREWLLNELPENLKTLPAEMYKFKSAYVLENLEEILRDDAKDNCDFGINEPVVMYQIETSDAGKLLQREDEILKIMDMLYPMRKHHILLIQDALNAKTFLICKSEQAIDALRHTSLRMEQIVSPSRYVLPRVTMRKSIQHAVSAN